MTYDGEFEKVHYPLPLSYLEEPDMQQMFRTFQRLQSHLKMSQSTAFMDRGNLMNDHALETQSERVGMNR